MVSLPAEVETGKTGEGFGILLWWYGNAKVM